MSDDVTVPRGEARLMAAWIRRLNDGGGGDVLRNEWADLLDPQPRSLREQVARAWCAEVYGEHSGSALAPAPDQLDAADAVLAVVADWLAAQPLSLTHLSEITEPTAWHNQRDHDVRLLRGTDG